MPPAASVYGKVTPQSKLAAMAGLTMSLTELIVAWIGAGLETVMIPFTAQSLSSEKASRRPCMREVALTAVQYGVVIVDGLIDLPAPGPRELVSASFVTGIWWQFTSTDAESDWPVSTIVAVFSFVPSSSSQVNVCSYVVEPLTPRTPEVARVRVVHVDCGVHIRHHRAREVDRSVTVSSVVPSSLATPSSS